MKLAVSDFGNLRALSHKISAAHKAGKGKWLYMRENLEGVDKLANVGLLLPGYGRLKKTTTYIRAFGPNEGGGLGGLRGPNRIIRFFCFVFLLPKMIYILSKMK